MRNIFDLSYNELVLALQQEGFAKYRAAQIWNWLYKRGVDDFSEMHNIAKKLQQYLQANFMVNPLKIVTEQKSQDGTIKWLFALADGKEIETVFIPEEKRGTLCISSQVGCTLNCKFCHTGTQLWQKNLTRAEIIAQIFFAKQLIGEFSSEKRLITNIVFMGMGEPLLNYDNVKQACKIIISPESFDFSWRKVTISTSGIIPAIAQMQNELKVGLAISLHASNNELRTEIMPINKKYPLAELLAVCKAYILKTDQKIMLEYVMLENVNDSQEHAAELIKMAKDMPVKFNLIPFNSWPGCAYKSSSNNRIHRFSELLFKAGIEAPIRKTRGADILAACGQLKSFLTKAEKS